MTFIQKILFTILIFTSANSIELNQNLMMDMSRAYGYSVGQTIYLDAIERKYPSLKNQVFLAKNEFNLKFSKSLNEIEYTFTKNMTQVQWSDFKFKLKNDLERQLDYNSITQNDAINFIDEVKTRANGNIESPIIETLIMFNPNYQNNPISELNDNFFQRYNSKDNPKAKGVNFSVRIPKSWKSQEANRPNIIRMFVANNGYIHEDKFMENVMLMVFDLPMEINSLTQQDITTICNDIPTNSVLRDCKKSNLENLPVVIQRIKMDMSRLENSLSMEIIQYNVYFKNKAIIIQGQVAASKDKVSENTILERFEKFKPIFNYVANSLVVNDLYRK